MPCAAGWTDQTGADVAAVGCFVWAAAVSGALAINNAKLMGAVHVVITAVTCRPSVLYFFTG